MVTRYNLYEAAADHRQFANRATVPATRSRKSISIADDSLPLSMKADWTELMFMQKQAGQHVDLCVRAVRDVRVSGAGGAVRKLVAAAGGDSGGAAVLALLGRAACCSRIRTSISSCRSD